MVPKEYIIWPSQYSIRLPYAYWKLLTHKLAAEKTRDNKKLLQYRPATVSKEICKRKQSAKRRIGKGKYKISEMVHDKVNLHSPWMSVQQKLI